MVVAIEERFTFRTIDDNGLNTRPEFEMSGKSSAAHSHDTGVGDGFNQIIIGNRQIRLPGTAQWYTEKK